MVKNKELSTLQEDNRLLAKQFRQKKEAEKKRRQFSQVSYHSSCLVNVHGNDAALSIFSRNK